VGENARKNDAATGTGRVGQHGGKHFQGIGENVGDHDIYGDLWRIVGQIKAGGDLILFCIELAGLNRLLVDVHADDLSGAEFHRGNGEDA